MIPVVDLFAGPGGLGEGFTSVIDNDGKPVFGIIMSIEKDPQAYKTLRLRSYVRKIANPDGSLPHEYLNYLKQPTDDNLNILLEYNPSAWENAQEEALCATLKDGDDTYVNEALKRLKNKGVLENGKWVLIGGPPCQAYSLVGRSRMSKNQEKLQKDVRQTLYKCYLSFINKLKPNIFVMENVIGILSAQHKGSGVFKHICEDMRAAGYEIHSLVTDRPSTPQDYVVEAEKYGVPQARHRVILLGVKTSAKSDNPEILREVDEITLGEALKGLPRIRSGFSENNKDWREMNWAEYVDNAARRLIKSGEVSDLEPILERVISSRPPKKRMKNRVSSEKGAYNDWYRGRLGKNRVLANHEARTHLAKDLDRYLFCSSFAEQYGYAPQLWDFPQSLLPEHKNVSSSKNLKKVDFSDRFRVQLYGRCSTTIVSHISKDGHYYIHPDPEQCRSLTVREAARLQTFPDDYFFEGNRTSQYTQVGNAVPPLLAQQVAKIVAKYLGVGARNFFDDLKEGQES